MKILGLQGSPRKKGNTRYLLDAFMEAAASRGAVTQTVQVVDINVTPCTGCSVCEKKGRCVIKDDDMPASMYPMLREADIIVMGTPIYFYNAPARMKAFIDRTQALWSRKYKLGLTDPKRSFRKGYLLSVGATKGKNLFEGMDLTAKYFFDAVGAEYTGSLVYRLIENPGDMAAHPTVSQDVQKAVDDVLQPLLDRKKVLFVCRENACRSQMAAAFASSLGGLKIDAVSAGSAPVQTINETMTTAMAEIGCDMMYRSPRSLEAALAEFRPDIMVTMGCDENCPYIPGVTRLDWDLPDPAGKSIEVMRNVRDQVKSHVEQLIASLSA